jgi:hypothetical protein
LPLLKTLAGLLVFGRRQIFGTHALKAAENAEAGNQIRARPVRAASPGNAPTSPARAPAQARGRGP